MDSDSANIGEDYACLFNGDNYRSWRRNNNILAIKGNEGCGKTTALRSAIKSLKMEVSNKLLLN